MRILKIFEIDNEKNIEANDYYQFFKYFGNNIDLYKSLKPFKDKTDISWEKVIDLQWRNIDLNK